jgi:hypothetical protein
MRACVVDVPTFFLPFPEAERAKTELRLPVHLTPWAASVFRHTAGDWP